MNNKPILDISKLYNKLYFYEKVYLVKTATKAGSVYSEYYIKNTPFDDLDDDIKEVITNKLLMDNKYIKNIDKNNSLL